MTIMNHGAYSTQSRGPTIPLARRVHAPRPRPGWSQAAPLCPCPGWRMRPPQCGSLHMHVHGRQAVHILVSLGGSSRTASCAILAKGENGPASAYLTLTTSVFIQLSTFPRPKCRLALPQPQQYCCCAVMPCQAAKLHTDRMPPAAQRTLPRAEVTLHHNFRVANVGGAAQPRPCGRLVLAVQSERAGTHCQPLGTVERQLRGGGRASPAGMGGGA